MNFAQFCRDIYHYILILISLGGGKGYAGRFNLVYETILKKWRDFLFLKIFLTSIYYFKQNTEISTPKSKVISSTINQKGKS